LPYPIAPRYTAHASATRDGTRVCLVLNASGNIHVFANGVQVFSFADGRWRLRGTGDKVVAWEHEVGNRPLAARLLRAAIASGEERCGSLFVVVDDAAGEERLVGA